MKTLVLALGLSALGCASAISNPNSQAAMDPHSHSSPGRVRVRHVELDLAIDMAGKSISGSAALTVERRDLAAPLVLDTRGLVIEGVRGADGSPRRHTLGVEDARLGAPLEIELLPGDEQVVVSYRTTERADALQWLAPEQTADGVRPFLFTQGQSIFTRSWIPLQDSPAVRVTYGARVRVVGDQDLTVVMSAEQLGRGADGAFRFRMPHPIPAYLIALACGRLEFRPISERCGIWAEPSVVAGARAEFEDTESMVRVAERLFGAYRWGRYDILVLPPAFPFGGMENPCLTFATPTVLTGDKSLVSLVAHELAHSWSGNLVTNATWRDFWLNEGFTVYFEQRIMEAVYGEERARTEWRLALDDLRRELTELEPWQQVLHIDLSARHPDEGFSGVPYTKGAALLKRIEQLYGRERMDAFLTRWFDGHAFQSVTTETFLAFLERELLASDPARAAALDLATWLRQPGLPADAPEADSPQLKRVDRILEAWKSRPDVALLDTSGFSTQQWLHLLEGLSGTLDGATLAALDRRFQLTQGTNSEIVCVWLRLAIAHEYSAADERLESFLLNIGRRKFLEPLYKELVKSEAGRARASALYVRARPRYHALTRSTIDGIVGWRG